jgi:hypothetical protein
MFKQLANFPQNVRRSLISNLADIPRVRCGDTPVISAEEIEKAQTRSIRVSEMADKLLNYCVRHGESMRHEYSYEDIDVIKSCYAFDGDEVQALVEYLSGLGFARQSSGTFRIGPAGYQYSQEGRGKNSDSQQVFIAMWFAPELHEVFELGLAKAASDCGYFPFRIDKKEHANKIDDEIIAEIRKSRFLIVDFTGHRGGAYFEAGFAMGIGLPIIWTCRKDHMAELHFDIRQYNCIDWTTIDELRRRLALRIEAWIGRGGQVTA